MPLKKRACLQYRTRGMGIRTTRYVTLLCGLAVMQSAPPVTAQYDAPEEPRLKTSKPMFFEHVPTSTVRVSTTGHPDAIRNAQSGPDCPNISTHTDADFDGPSEFSTLFGFASGEIAAATYTLETGFFPIEISKVEMVFAQTGVTETTATDVSLFIWKGTPGTGQVGFAATTLVIQAPDNAVNLVFDLSAAPVQVTAEDGAADFNTFSVGIKIDLHHDPSDNPCLENPDPDSNAFPAVDTSGVSTATDNWMFVLNCGPFDCPSGWRRFDDLGDCEPEGDWVIRASWTPTVCPAEGACCLDDGTCLDDSNEFACADAGGTIQEGLACTPELCQPKGACCTGKSGQTCFEDVTEDQCLQLPHGGVWHGSGSDCTDANFDGTADVCEIPTGACCLPSGGCENNVNLADCDAQGGGYKGDDTNCTGEVCEGACCFNTLCLGDATGADCDDAGGTWQGPALSCDDNVNPCAGDPLTGACCSAEGLICDDVLEDACTMQGGSWFGPGSVCNSLQCDQPLTGACCLPTGVCQGGETEEDCSAAGGAYAGDGTDCTDCPTQACCFEGAGCLDLSADNCTEAAGMPGGEGTSCATFICPLPDGACCFDADDPFCLDLTLSECNQGGGDWKGVSTECATESCIVPGAGACCLGSGQCLADQTLDECLAADGNYSGNDTDCTSCDTEACCFGGPGCLDLTSSLCSSAGGAAQGAGTTCATTTCPQATGACCFSTGFCIELTATNCSEGGGLWDGSGTVCSPELCENIAIGACCLPDETCMEDQTPFTCADQGGDFQGDATICSNVDCGTIPKTEACCVPSEGNCVDFTRTDCILIASIPQGLGTNCASTECPEPGTGACCLSDGNCQPDASVEDCTAAGGTQQGDGTTCLVGLCCQSDPDCNDSDACNGEETCVSNACEPGTSLTCDDGDPCTDDSCDPALGCVTDPADCDDADACTDDSCDPASGCVHDPIDPATCDDSDDCTMDSCEPATGCVNAPLVPCCGNGITEEPEDCDPPDGITCDQNCRFLPTGACCQSDNMCDGGLSSVQCMMGGGTYQGDDTLCVDIDCTVIGACCFANGNCTVTTESACGAQMGTYQSDGSDCDPNPCPQPPPGACCLPLGGCQEDTSADDCAALGGVHQGGGSFCEPGLCLGCLPNPGAAENDCCADAIPLLGGLTDFTTANAHTDGPAHECGFLVSVHHDIWYTYVAECDAEATFTTCDDLGGTADFDTKVAIFDGCDCDNLFLLGCNDDDEVNVCGEFPVNQSTLTVPLVQDNCYRVRVGGFDEGDTGTGTLLFDPGCPSTCPADFDGNGLVRVPDLIFLLGEWGDNPGSPADLDGNGLVRVPDLIILLGAWGECP